VIDAEGACRPPASLRAERADARSVTELVRLKRPCIKRRSGAALRLGLRARPPSDPDDRDSCRRGSFLHADPGALLGAD
jgi:hypothetical protein